MGLFACFQPPQAGWGGPGYGDAAASARARLLEVVEEEVEERYGALGPLPLGASAARASHDAAFMRRLYKANLPAAEMGRAKDLLRKLAALDAARMAAETEQQALAGQLKAAEAAHRQAEFARARAEAIATARGEALMHAQQATREAELAKAHMEEVLQLAIDRLGIELTPGPSGQVDLSPLVTPAPQGGDAATPAAVRQSIFSEQQLALVAASLNKLPRQPSTLSWRGGDVLPEGGLPALQRVSEADEAEAEAEHRHRQQQRFRASLEREAEREAAERAAAAEAQRAQRRASRRGSEQGSQREAAAAAQARRSAEQGLSGFTVYTNSLQAADEDGGGDGDAGEVVQPPRAGHAARHSASAPASVVGGERDSQGSGVQWRSISSAALSTRSLESLEAHEQEAEEEAWQRGRQAGRASQPDSRAGSQVRQQLGSLEVAAQAVAAGGSWEQQQAGRLQAYAQQLSKLMLPGMDASQMDSLVRIGASQQSPDPHSRARRTSADASAPARQWDSEANPLLQLQSEQEGDRLLRGARGEWQQQNSSRPASRPGSRRPSQDNGPVAQSMAAAVGRAQQSAAPRGPRAGSEPPVGRQGPRVGSEPPPMLQVPVFDGGKVPGAGTWVSPSLAAMIAHKKGHNPLLDGGEPSPPSHIKAVFATNEDREFYGPMAAHLNKRDAPAGAGAMPPPPPRPPTSTSAESIRGPARQHPPSNRSSLEGGSAEWEARQLAAASQDAGLAQQQQAGQAPPDRRQAALASRFQPMGQHVSGQPQQQAPRRSSVAVSQLGGTQRGGDENGVAAGALGRSSVRGSGLPPRHVGGPGQQQVPPTKRSMDSLRGSMGIAGPAGQDVKDSLSAVEAAMAALRGANPHLSQQHAAAQPHAQSQPLPPQAYGRASAAAAPSGHPRQQQGAAPRPAVHHTRTRSLPESSLDLPLEEHQRRRQAAAAAAAAQQAQYAYRQ